MQTESKFTELITDKKVKTKWRQSIFIVTINTNQTYNSRDMEVLKRMPEIDREFDDLLHNLFDRRNLIKLFVDIGKPKSGQRILLNPDRVKEIEANTQKEVNTDGKGFLHSHTIIKIVHDTRVLVNLQLVRNVVKKKLENVLTFNGKFKSPVVMVKANNTSYQLEKYVNSNSN
jgi:hypothetical protein